MNDAVIVDAVRTPVGRRGGMVKDHHPGHLAAMVLRALVDRTGVGRSLVEDGAGSRFGLQAMCEGGGTANATILELCS